jgi:cytochrome b6-f complex iron-sulfur subunit
MERRKFCRNFTFSGSLLITVPVLFNACCDDLEEENVYTIDLSDPAYAALKTVGGFTYKEDIIIIRYSETEYLALSKVCTHQGCEVSYNSSGSYLPCPCHGSVFSTTGSVLNGPAVTNLRSYNVKLTGNSLIIT